MLAQYQSTFLSAFLSQARDFGWRQALSYVSRFHSIPIASACGELQVLIPRPIQVFRCVSQAEIQSGVRNIKQNKNHGEYVRGKKKKRMQQRQKGERENAKTINLGNTTTASESGHLPLLLPKFPHPSTTIDSADIITTFKRRQITEICLSISPEGPYVSEDQRQQKALSIDYDLQVQDKYRPFSDVWLKQTPQDSPSKRRPVRCRACVIYSLRRRWRSWASWLLLSRLLSVDVCIKVVCLLLVLTSLLSPLITVE